MGVRRVGVRRVGGPKGGGPEGWGAQPRKSGAPKGGALKGGCSNGGGRVGGPKVRAFFSLARRNIRSFFPLWGSCAAGTLPSPPWEWVKPNRDEATARATAHANIPPHRIRQACSARFLIKGISLRARAIANALRNPLVSSDHRPPTSIAATTKCARRPGSKNSG